MRYTQKDVRCHIETIKQFTKTRGITRLGAGDIQTLRLYRANGTVTLVATLPDGSTGTTEYPPRGTREITRYLQGIADALHALHTR